jgi:hypothetical protein
MEKVSMNRIASMKTLLPILAFSLLLISCEKEIDVNLSEGDKKMVVEGVIETGTQPYVTLTKSIGFFDKIDLGAVQYVKGAIVTVEDLTSGKAVTLREYNIDTTIGNQTFSFNLYGPDFNDPNAMAFVGQVEHLYRLRIVSEGNTHEAYTRIPANPGLDSLWIEPVPGREDSFASVKAWYTDPDTMGNCVRLETRANRYVKDGNPELFFTSFNSVYDDNIINGTRIPLTIDLGFDRTRTLERTDFETIGYVRPGDTITIKWASIDRNIFNFYQTLSFAQGSVGNPFAAPIKVQGNVSNALGYFAGFGSQYYTIIDSL